jgi:hypothetical protein
VAVQLTCKDCLSPEFCAVDGCAKRPPQALGPALAPLRPIELPRLVRQPRPKPAPAEYQPGRIMRALMTWQDAGPERARKRAWFLRPFVASPPPDGAAFAAILEEVATIMSAPAPLDLPLKPPKAGAKLVITIARNGKPVAIHDGEAIGAGTPEDVADAVRVWLVGG